MRGWYRSLSPARKFIGEILHHAHPVPSLPVVRRVNLADVAAVRGRAVSWLAIFLRAYGLTAREHPELRTALIPYPWPRLYEHPETLASLLVERRHEGERVTLVAKVRGPENQSLPQLHAHLQRFKTAPLHEISDFRQLLLIGRFPWLLRRFTFWTTLYWSGPMRARRFGTCTVSTMGHHDAEQVHPITPLTTYFTVSPIQPDGEASLRIIYDHRVMDDGHVARALRTLEEVLHTRMVAELRQLTHRFSRTVKRRYASSTRAA